MADLRHKISAEEQNHTVMLNRVRSDLTTGEVISPDKAHVTIRNCFA